MCLGKLISFNWIEKTMMRRSIKMISFGMKIWHLIFVYWHLMGSLCFVVDCHTECQCACVKILQFYVLEICMWTYSTSIFFYFVCALCSRWLTLFFSLLMCLSQSFNLALISFVAWGRLQHILLWKNEATRKM